MCTMRVIQKVLSLTQKDEPEMNIFVEATHYHFLYKKKKKKKKKNQISVNFCADEAYTKK